MELDALKSRLENLLQTLQLCDVPFLAEEISQAINGTDDELRNFLVSNELWGGAGSIADQGSFAISQEMKLPFHKALVELGEKQIELGLTNLRTDFWVRGHRAILSEKG